MVGFFHALFFLVLSIGLFVILTNNPVHSILGLVLVFCLSAVFSIVIGVEFLAALILIVYVGAISVLFLFVVMLLNIRVLELNASFVKYWWLGVLYVVFFSLNLYYMVFTNLGDSAVFFSKAFYNDFSFYFLDWSSVAQLGEVLFLYFPHLLIFSALVLFLAIVSPVILSFVRFGGEIDSVTSWALYRRQETFTQMLRLSIERHFK